MISEKKSIFINLEFKNYIKNIKNIKNKSHLINKITKDLKLITYKMDLINEKNAKIIQNKVRQFLYKPESLFYQKAKKDFYKLSHSLL